MRDRTKNHGMNWITQVKRLAIYLRDGLACAYCGEGIEQGAALTLDHVKPARRRGSNSERNLVTACSRCNMGKGKRPMEDFAHATAEYLNHAVTADQIVGHVNSQTRRSLPMEQARALIESRGSAAKALAHLRENGGAR
jgi:CRISPR/Cas system Type II protein with McrA/HNH and RuvC-like nuclease domain